MNVYLEIIFASIFVLEPTLAKLWHHAATLEHKPHLWQTMHEYKHAVPLLMLMPEYKVLSWYVQEIQLLHITLSLPMESKLVSEHSACLHGSCKNILTDLIIGKQLVFCSDFHCHY